MRKLSCSLRGALLSLALSCSSTPPPTTRTAGAPATATAPIADSRSQSSARFGYSWGLPEGWTFRPPEPFWNSPPAPAIDVYAAQQSSEGPVLLVIVTDHVHVVAGSH